MFEEEDVGRETKKKKKKKHKAKHDTDSDSVHGKEKVIYSSRALINFSMNEVFRIIPDFRIFRLTFHRKAASKF